MLRVGSRLLKAHAGRLSYPLKLNLCFTYWCQYRCQTCNIWKRKPTDELTTDEWLAFIAANRGPEWVDVTGGEIFLRDDVAVFLEALVASWHHLAVLHFPTNGFLSDKIVSVTTQLQRRTRVPIVVTVSIDGDAGLNDKIRGIKGGFARQVETFRRLRADGVSAVFGLTVSSFNARAVGETYAALERECPGLTPRDFHVNVAQTSSHYYGTTADAPYRPSREEALAALDAYAALRGAAWRPTERLEARYLALLRRFVTTGLTPQPCHALRSSCFIDPWGTVYPCISFDRPIGSLRDHQMRLDPIWTGEAARATARGIWAGQCPQCWTACEAYQTILGNALAPWRSAPSSGGVDPSGGGAA